MSWTLIVLPHFSMQSEVSKIKWQDNCTSCLFRLISLFFLNFLYYWWNQNRLKQYCLAPIFSVPSMYVWSCHDIYGLIFCSNYKVKIKLNHHIYLLRLEDIIPSAPTYPYSFFSCDVLRNYYTRYYNPLIIW